LEQAIKLVGRTGIDYFQVKPMYIHTNHGNAWRFGFDGMDYRPYLERATALRREGFNVVVTKRALFEGQKRSARRGCLAANFIAQIAPSGPNQAGLYVCCEFKGHPAYKLGEVWDRESFEAAWEAKREFVENLDLSGCKPYCAPFELNAQLRAIRQRGKLITQSPEPVLHEWFL
jgi:hypothetical protein